MNPSPCRQRWPRLLEHEVEWIRGTRTRATHTPTSREKKSSIFYVGEGPHPQEKIDDFFSRLVGVCVARVRVPRIHSTSCSSSRGHRCRHGDGFIRRGGC